MTTISLTLTEMRLAAEGGITRRLTSMMQENRQAAGFNGRGAWEIDILGAMAEMAFAKFYGLYWTPSVNVFKVPDVGAVFIRSSYLDNSRLIVRPTDPDGVYSLVITKPPAFRIAGWYFAQDARQEKFLARLEDGRPPAYAVPQSVLYPPNTVPAQVLA